MTAKVVFMGGGNMATSLISGLRQAGWSPESITVIDHNADKCERLNTDYGITAVTRPEPAHFADADAVVLATKPQVMADTARELAPLLGAHRPLILSIAAGIPLVALRDWLGEDFAYIRCMPNTPSLLGVGATGLYAESDTTAEQCRLADDIMATTGVNVWVDEERRIDAVIATAGSAPAYFFAFMEAITDSAVAMGLDRESARTLALQTALGSARMALESGDDPATLRRKVTSPGGTTAAALEHLQAGHLDQLVGGAMQAAADRAAELARELSPS